MNNKMRNQFLLVAFGVSLYAVLMNLGTVWSFLWDMFDLLFPIATGFIIAFVLNVPMTGIEKKIEKWCCKGKRKLNQKVLSAISLFLTLVLVAIVVALVITMVIPELVSSVKSLYNTVLEKWPEVEKTLQTYHINSTWISELLLNIDIEKIVKQISANTGSFVSSTVDIASLAVSRLTSVGIAFVLSIYVLLSKHDLTRQAKKLASAHLKEKTVKKISYVVGLINQIYSKFLSGQCLEACILALLIFIAFRIFRIPYANLIGVLAGVCAFIPYIGALLACAIGTFLILLTNPSQVLICIIVYLVVQFIENQLIYPNVVGSSVGLSPLWTLIAVFVGGKWMGLFGMIFFIPLIAVVSTLLREHTNHKLNKKTKETKSCG